MVAALLVEILCSTELHLLAVAMAVVKVVKMAVLVVLVAGRLVVLHLAQQEQELLVKGIMAQ
jgi:hypothetical protein